MHSWCNIPELVGNSAVFKHLQERRRQREAPVIDQQEWHSTGSINNHEAAGAVRWQFRSWDDQLSVGHLLQRMAARHESRTQSSFEYIRMEPGR